MKRSVAVLLTVIVLLGATCGVLLYQISVMQNKIDELEQELYQRKLADAKLVNITEVTFPVAGESAYMKAIVKLENFGIYNVNELTVEINRVNQSTGEREYEGEKEVGLIKPRESKLVNIDLSQPLVAGIDLTATLMLDDTVIDEKSRAFGYLAGT